MPQTPQSATYIIAWTHIGNRKYSLKAIYLKRGPWLGTVPIGVPTLRTNEVVLHGRTSALHPTPKFKRTHHPGSCVIRLEIAGPLDQCNTTWEPAQIAFDLVDDMTTDPVVTVTVDTPAGVLKLMAEPERVGRTLVLHGLHLQDLSPNAIGPANLIVLAHVVMQRMDVDELVVEGGLRTTGANPGRRPRVLRFSRRIRAAADRPPSP
jgi:hypothetical protein